MLHVKGWGWLEAADGKNLSKTRPAKSESEAYCKSGLEHSMAHYSSLPVAPQGGLVEAIDLLLVALAT